MAKFIPLTVRERIEGTPGIVEAQEFEVYVNLDEITLFNRGDDPDITFVRLVCGATLCVPLSYDKFVKKLQSVGYDLQNEKKGKKK